METGYSLIQMVFEKKAFGSSYHESVIDTVSSRSASLASD